MSDGNGSGGNSLAEMAKRDMGNIIAVEEVEESREPTTTAPVSPQKGMEPKSKASSAPKKPPAKRGRKPKAVGDLVQGKARPVTLKDLNSQGCMKVSMMIPCHLVAKLDQIGTWEEKDRSIVVLEGLTNVVDKYPLHELYDKMPNIQRATALFHEKRSLAESGEGDEE